MEVMTDSSEVGRLAVQAKKIARDVDAFGQGFPGTGPGVGSLALAVEMLADAIALLQETKDR
jgi:hypothetical protein